MPINPYKQARELLGKTQGEVAREAGCSPSAVMYNEAGLYVAPLPVLTQYYEDWFKKTSLEQGYFRFQSHVRADNKRLWLLPEPNVFREPIKAAISYNDLTVTRFNKLFCCQPMLLRNPRRIKGKLEKILLDAGFTIVQIEELQERLNEFADRQGRSSTSVR